MTPESKATQEVMLGASECKMRLLRNNSGAAYNQDGRLFRFGLGNESKELNEETAFGDRVGWYTLTITEEMVGKKVAVFTMIEVKAEGKLKGVLKRALNVYKSREAAQKRAIDLVRKAGGIAWFASNANDVKAILQNYLQELKK